MVTHFNVLVQNIWFKTKKIESTERWKTSFRKEVVENVDIHKPVLNIKQNNDHTRIMRKIQFRSSFKFLSWLFALVGKTAWLENIRLIAKFMMSQPVKEAITIYIIPNIQE